MQRTNWDHFKRISEHACSLPFSIRSLLFPTMKISEKKIFTEAKALFVKGSLALEQGYLIDAEEKLLACLKLIPDRESTKNNLAILYSAKADNYADKGDIYRALEDYGQALIYNPRYFLALSNKGRLLTEHFDQFDEAISLLHNCIRVAPKYVDAHVNLGIAYARKGELQASIKSFEEALHLNPESVEALVSLGQAFLKISAPEKAIESFEKALELNSESSEIWSYRSDALNQVGQHTEAVKGYDHAISLQPDFAEAWNNRGIALIDLKRYEDALASYEEAIKLRPNFAEAWNNHGNALSDIKYFNRAVTSYERAIELRPEFAEAWCNHGNLLSQIKRHEEALLSCARAIELRPNYAEAWSRRGEALIELKRDLEAINSFERALYLQPSQDFLLGMTVHTKNKVCDWSHLESDLSKLRSAIALGEKVMTPFATLGLFDDPQIQQASAEIFAREFPSQTSLLGPIAPRIKPRRICIGYYSMDFRDHPVSHLIADLIDFHDREKFEIFGFSFSLNRNDSMRAKLEKSFDRFFDLSLSSPIEIARFSRKCGVDIAIDLGGYTQDSRPQIFAYRVAPIQVSYLGYPGTMGTKSIDYFIGDHITINDDNRHFFTEKIIHLPNSFQSNSIRHHSPNSEKSRASYNLPDDAFVFCCMNNTWKIIPDTFQTWIEILQEVPKSVLWVYIENYYGRENLQNLFQSHGVKKDRLIFARRLSRHEYLDQYRFADLFLDTLPYNAGATASDALWMGLPVLTRRGRSFAGRMASSLLSSVGLPELITETYEEYKSLAVELAKDPGRLAAIRKKLVNDRHAHPLFNSQLFAQHIEEGFKAIHSRYEAGLSPAHIYVGS